MVFKEYMVYECLTFINLTKVLPIILTMLRAVIANSILFYKLGSLVFLGGLKVLLLARILKMFSMSSCVSS
jgi:hypothetical protein